MQDILQIGCPGNRHSTLSQADNTPLRLRLGVYMHPNREHIFAVGPEERRTMVRKLLVELERLWACYNDGSQRPIDEQTLFSGAKVSS